MITGGDEEILKNSIEIIKDNLPKIIHKAKYQDLKELIEPSNNLLKIIENWNENQQEIKDYIDDMNSDCNNMFFFVTKNKLKKNLKNLIIETILAGLHINEIYGIQVKYIEEYDNGKYEGELKDGKREGFGKYIYSTGDIYEGEFKNGYKDGKGKYTYCNKDVYEGDYKEGKIHGKGKYTYVEGDIYEGEYFNGRREGKGTYKYSNGNKYVGKWKEGKKHGFGIYYYNDKSIYEGEFVKGKKEGKGKYFCFNGDTYEGDYKNDKREG